MRQATALATTTSSAMIEPAIPNAISTVYTGPMSRRFAYARFEPANAFASVTKHAGVVTHLRPAAQEAGDVDCDMAAQALR
jgi:hypothetical protein